MTVHSVLMFKDDAGNLHTSEEAAKHANGLVALQRKLAEQNFIPAVESAILLNFQDWYITYLEASK